jgi:hypothetical protein
MTADDTLVAHQGQQVDIFVCPPMAAGDNLGFSTMRECDTLVFHHW